MGTDLISKIHDSPKSEPNWAAWYKSVYPQLYYAAYRFVNGNTEAAKDLTQESFARFIRYKAIDRVTNDEHALAFLIKTCRNLANNRNAVGQGIQLEHLDEKFESIPEREQPIDPSIDVDRMLKTLQSEDRRLIKWVLEGVSVSEIAGKLGVSYTAAGVRLHRIRKRMQNSIQGM